MAESAAADCVAAGHLARGFNRQGYTPTTENDRGGLGIRPHVRTEGMTMTIHETEPRLAAIRKTEQSERVVVSRAQACMGTTVSVHIAATPAREGHARESVEEALHWLAEVDACLSRFRPESELCALNRSSGRWFAASPLLFAAVERALLAAEESNGLFDPTLLPQLEALGYDRDFSAIAHREALPTTDVDAWSDGRTRSRGAWHDIPLDVRARRILLPPGVRLDLGGIAKGWAADVACERFGAGYTGVLVNVGGDIRLHGGPRPGVGWSVALPDPRGTASVSPDPTRASETEVGEPPLATLTLSRGGLATSGAVRRWWLRGGRLTHHLLDPRTGEPIPLWVAAPRDGTVIDHQRIASVTALAPTAAQAEVATKVALLTGLSDALTPSPYAGIARSAAHGSLVPQDSVAIIVVPGSGPFVPSPTLGAYLSTWGTEGASVPYMLRSGAAQARA